MINHILYTGQSLAAGFTSGVSLPVANTDIDAFLWNGSSYTALAQPNNTQTRPAIPATNYLAQNSITQWGTSGSVLGGSLYIDIKKGTTTYNDNINTASALTGISTIKGVMVLHGYTDNDSATYGADILEWQDDYNTDIKAAIGQTEDVPFFIYQNPRPNIKNTHLGATEAHDASGLVNLVMPVYQIPKIDSVHATATGYHYIGETFGRVMRSVLVGGTNWEPLRPSKIVASGTTVTIEFLVPSGNLQINTTQFAAQTNFGFSLKNNTSNITSVSITGTNEITLVLDSVPATNEFIEYSGGNITDSDPTLASIDNTPLPNWLIKFSEALDFDLGINSAPVITNNDIVSVVGVPVSVSIQVTDADNDLNTCTASNLPPGISLQFGDMTGTPTVAGVYPVIITCNDDAGNITNHNIVWTINATTVDYCLATSNKSVANTAPIISTISSLTSFVGESISIPVVTSDADGDTVTCTASNLPPGASITSNTISGVLTSSGIYNVIVTCIDGNGGVASTNFTITVEAMAQDAWYVDSNQATNGIGTQTSPWNSFANIDYDNSIDPSSIKTLYVIGGTYTDQLAPRGTVQLIQALGNVLHVGPRSSPLPQCGSSSTIASVNTGISGIDLSNAPSGLVISGSQWDGWVLTRWQSDGIRYENSTNNTILEYMTVHDNGYYTLDTDWDCNRTVCGSSLCTYNGAAVAYPQGANLRIDGTNNLIRFMNIANAGQDAIQNQNSSMINGFTVENSVLYNGKSNTLASGVGGPLGGTNIESFNYCSHVDGIQIYENATNITIRNSAIINMTNGLILGDSNADVTNVTIDNVHIINYADNGILANSTNGGDDNWTISNTILYSHIVKNNHIQSSNGANDWTITNTVIGGNSNTVGMNAPCSMVNFFGFGANLINGSGNFTDSNNGITYGTGAGTIFTDVPIVWNNAPMTFSNVFYDVGNNVNTILSDTLSDVINATVNNGYNSLGLIEIS